MKYVVSDIHGRLDRLKRLVEVISLKDDDTLYVLGDMVDRGEESIEVIQYIMDKKNIEAIMGNHDRMMLYSLKNMDETEIRRWNRNGNETTLQGFNKLSKKEQGKILSFLESLEYYKIVDEKYFLVHAGIDMVKLKEDINIKSFKEAMNSQEHQLVWVREDFFMNKGFEDYTVVFGHNPRPYLDKKFEKEVKKPYKIWFDKIYKDKICIDTANCYEEGRMACLRLDDMAEFYVD
ncbi:metallophosphoesterase family protein [Oceanirhabdus sp. W0125-5]|uniref:metallophosphoesterase family protein n=1 Tax=Oceanirhabdus sp. W0125-5 TaxID=2999116 RepID=UPI0022F33255|nr:metallophosphoesterase family protein [Oceanirhabdus sp. W0125-5]WBW99128.1 metallophosphoesterase family protein [Oceanirhabdus sp. W0125-5]